MITTTTITRWIAIAAALALLALAMSLAASSNTGIGPAPAIAADKDCSDFKTQKKAQKFFKKHNPRRDPHGLDADNDRIACEENPVPAPRSGTSSIGRR